MTSLLGLSTQADLVHARSYVAASAALPFCMATKTPLLFDMRGLWADERIEDGSWPKDGPVDRGLRAMEKTLLSRASAITVLTNAMARHLRYNPSPALSIPSPIHVIPTCTDLNLFKPNLRPDPEITQLVKGTNSLIYLGALGGRNLIDEMTQFYLKWRKIVGPSRFLVISKDSPVRIRERLGSANASKDLIHVPLARSRVPSALRCGAAGLFLYRGSVGTIGVAPTKMGEFLGAGLPVAGNPVGDVAQLLSGQAGVLVNNLDDGTLEDAAHQLYLRSRDPKTPSVCRSVAEKWFSLSSGLSAYDQIYRSLMNHNQVTSLQDTHWPPPNRELPAVINGDEHVRNNRHL